MQKLKNLTFSDLMLIRLLSSTENGLTIGEQKKSLKHFILNSPSGDQWLHELEQLTERGLLEKKNRARFRITPKGEEVALKILNLSSLPRPIRWQTLKNCYLIATVLELPAPINVRDRQHIASADGLRACILDNAYKLSSIPYLSLPKVRDILLWQQLADTTATAKLKIKLETFSTGKPRPFTKDSIMALLLNNLIGTERELSWQLALKQLAAKVVNARRIDPEELRRALLTTATAKKALPEPSIDLKAFAAQVKQSANQCQTGKFGEKKIFISHVWKQMELDGKQFGLNFDQFKHYLALANNKGLISLTHADLTYAMNRNDVSTSETPYLNSVFHFIRLE